MTHHLSFSSAIAIGAVLIGQALSGCTSTDVIEPSDKQVEISNEITLAISSPESARATRAGTDHKLRYTAKLFEGDYTKGIKFLERKEEIATEGKATITFSVPEGTYSVILFADYIPASAERNAKGLYDDRYYDTSQENEHVSTIAFTTNEGRTAIDYNCINNDNYDAFAAYHAITKTEEEYVRDITLNRIVSKVRVVSATPLPDGIDVESIKFSRFSYLKTYSIASGYATDHAEYGKMNLTNNIFQGMSDQSQQELFFFYTLADKTKNNFLEDVNFNITFSDKSTRATEVPKGTIMVQKNYITTLSGAFLADPAPELGDIILNLSSQDEWETDPKLIPF